MITINTPSRRISNLVHFFSTMRKGKNAERCLSLWKDVERSRRDQSRTFFVVCAPMFWRKSALKFVRGCVLFWVLYGIYLSFWGPITLILGPTTLILDPITLVLGPISLILGRIALISGPDSAHFGIRNAHLGSATLILGPMYSDKKHSGNVKSWNVQEERACTSLYQNAACVSHTSLPYISDCSITSTIV